jgi:hypothetical protein
MFALITDVAHLSGFPIFRASSTCFSKASLRDDLSNAMGTVLPVSSLTLRVADKSMTLRESLERLTMPFAIGPNGSIT